MLDSVKRQQHTQFFAMSPNIPCTQSRPGRIFASAFARGLVVVVLLSISSSFPATSLAADVYNGVQGGEEVDDAALTADEEAEATAEGVSLQPTRVRHASHMWWDDLSEVGLGAAERLFEAEIRGMTRCRKRLRDRMFVAAGQAPHSILRYSTYRYNSASFLLNVLVRGRSADFIRGCSWMDVGEGWQEGDGVEEVRRKSRRIEGHVFHRGSYHKGVDYNTFVVGCRFEEPAIVTGAGGFLLLRVEGDATNSSLLVHHDLPAACQKEPRGAYKRGKEKKDIAFCTPPIFSHFDPSLLDQWIQYHWALSEKKAHFFMYVGVGMNAEWRAVVQKLEGAGLVTVENTSGLSKYGSVFFGAQSLFLHDCQHRAIDDFKWVINNDFDEYIHFPISPTTSIVDFLAQRARFDFLSFGNTIYTYVTCEGPEVADSSHQRWPVERMVFRRLGPYCKNVRDARKRDPNFCGGSSGRRKYAMNPAVVLGFLHPHGVMTMDGFNHGFHERGNDVKSTVTCAVNVVLAHYRHFISEATCSESMDTFLATQQARYKNGSGFESALWERDLGVREIVERLRDTNSFF